MQFSVCFILGENFRLVMIYLPGLQTLIGKEMLIQRFGNRNEAKITVLKKARIKIANKQEALSTIFRGEKICGVNIQYQQILTNKKK